MYLVRIELIGLVSISLVFGDSVVKVCDRLVMVFELLQLNMIVFRFLFICLRIFGLVLNLCVVGLFGLLNWLMKQVFGVFLVMCLVMFWQYLGWFLVMFEWVRCILVFIVLRLKIFLWDILFGMIRISLQFFCCVISVRFRLVLLVVFFISVVLGLRFLCCLVVLIIDRLMWFLIDFLGLVFLSFRNSLQMLVFRCWVLMIGVWLMRLSMEEWIVIGLY